MPNRIIKESICTSDSIDKLSIEAERLFYRLIVNCDDYGILDARIQIIKCKCFPLKAADISKEQLTSWLKELEQQNMIFFYENKGKLYLKMTNWEAHQRVRSKRSKYPLPDDENSNLTTHDSNLTTHDSNLTTHDSNLTTHDAVIQSNPIQSESNPNPNPIPSLNPADNQEKSEKVSYSVVQNLYLSICTEFPKITVLSEARKKAIRARFKSGYTLEDFKKLFENAQASKFLKGGNDHNWSADFDWLIKDSNMAKVLEGKYNERLRDDNTEDNGETRQDTGANKCDVCGDPVL